MKKLTTVVLLVITFTANATTYYFSATGNDANNGTSTSTPWKTISKFNSVFASKSPGDNFLFRRGDVFYGNLIISRSGSSGKPITIGAYGTGADPVITGFKTVSAWTNLGNNIWESTGAVSSLSTANMVVISGKNTAMGRYPNTGYVTYQSFSGDTKITSSGIGSTNWTGAEAVIRKQRWIIDRNHITAQSGGTLTYKSASTYPGQAGYGFFIQNDSRTLDKQNEWYYNPSTKKLRIYSTSTPANVQVTTKDTLAYMKYRGYITFDNISFQGSNKVAFVILSSNNITIQNCAIDYSGYDAIWGNQNWGKPSSSFVLKNSTTNHTNNNAISLASEFAGALISHNIFKNTGMIVGMSGSGDGMGAAIQTRANSVIIEYNEIDSVGYVGIGFYNNNTIVRNNFVNGFNFVKLDGAGIYTWVGVGNSPFTGQKVLNNIVMNGFGDNAGTTATGSPISHGIYMDDWVANVEVAGNTTANCPHTGLYIHKAHDLNVHNNTSFNNTKYQVLLVSSDAGSPIRNDKMRNNIFVSKTSTQMVTSFQSRIDDIKSFGAIDSNYYARPISDNVVFYVTINNVASFFNYALTQWQTYSGFDKHSHKSPKTITTVNDLRFEYNATSANKTISLDGNYIDVKSKAYNGTITLAPYTSAVLIRNGAATANRAPTANAGSDKTVTLPTSTVTLSGSGADSDGSISNYSWAKVGGPSSGTITSTTSATTTVTSLVQGVYKFQLKVIDNAGISDLDTVQVTVNTAAGTLLPAVNPANTVNGLDYKYYEAGNGYSAVPNFSGLTPVKSGATTNFDLSLAKKSVAYAFNFTGFITVPTDGQYTFYTSSDDGSKLYIDNVLVANNDGLHGAREKSGTIGLKAGKHAISVGYFQQGVGKILTVSYAGPGISKKTIPTSALYRISTSGLVALDNNSQSIISSEQVGVKAYPNPFADHIEINITGGAAGEYKLMLFDALGRMVWTKSGVKNAGAFQQSVNTATLLKGVYFLRVTQNDVSSVTKLVK